MGMASTLPWSLLGLGAQSWVSRAWCSAVVCVCQCLQSGVVRCWLLASGAVGCSGNVLAAVLWLWVQLLQKCAGDSTGDLARVVGQLLLWLAE